MNEQLQNAAPAEAELIALLTANSFSPIIDRCVGCAHVRVHDGKGYCRSYANPNAKWTLGMCNFATHARIEKAESKTLNPLKASKRGGR